MIVFVTVSTYTRQSISRLTNSLLMTSSPTTRLQCLTQCNTNKTCNSANYNTASSTCELNQHPNGPNMTNAISASNWEWFMPSYQILPVVDP